MIIKTVKSIKQPRELKISISGADEEQVRELLRKAVAGVRKMNRQLEAANGSKIGYEIQASIDSVSMES